MILRVSYEKIPKFCKVCGLLGHKYDECGSGVHDPQSFQYGDWMLADTPWNRPRGHGTAVPPKPRQAPPPNTNNTANGKGKGTERGPHNGGVHIQIWEAKKRSASDANLDGPVAEPGKASTQERGSSSTGVPLLMDKPVDDSTDLGKEADSREGTPPLPPSYVALRDLKKQNKNRTPKKMARNKAGSEEERRREQ